MKILVKRVNFISEDGEYISGEEYYYAPKNFFEYNEMLEKVAEHFGITRDQFFGGEAPDQFYKKLDEIRYAADFKGVKVDSIEEVSHVPSGYRKINCISAPGELYSIEQIKKAIEIIEN